jgi:nucleoside-diphosphate-sugar epimerase
MSSGIALVTGASGLLGQNLVAALVARGQRVRALLRPGSAGLPTALRGLPRIELVHAELDDRKALRQALQGVRQVYHLAGRLLSPGVPDGDYRAIHVDGTRGLLEACAEQDGLEAIIHCSTTGVLGPTGPSPRDELAPMRPSNVYERSKAEGEQLALDLAARSGLALVVARPALVYGPGDMHLLGWFRAIDRGYYHVVGSGDSLLHPIYVDDLSQGLLRCADTPAAAGRVYHLVGARPLPIRELAAAIAASLGRRLPRLHLPFAAALLLAGLLEALPGLPPTALPLTRSRVMFMSESRAYCGCRAAAELDFRPRVELDEGLRRTVRWYRAQGLL